MFEIKDSRYSLARIQSAWKHAPHELLSLWDMISVSSHSLVCAMDRLSFIELCAKAQLQLPSKDVGPSKQEKKVLTEELIKMWPAFSDLELERCVARLNNFLLLLHGYDGHAYCTYGVIHSESRGLLNEILTETGERSLIFIEKEKLAFLHKDSLFGDSVNRCFPSTKLEIKEAGNALAADLNTAAVFHLMRTLEFGLRALTKHLKVNSIKKKPTSKPIPIDLGTWEEIIVSINEKLSKLRGKTRSKKRESELDFYNELLNELRSVKDLWRNKVMHARVVYDANQAKSAFNHVKIFMQKLATKVSETN